MVRVDPDDDSTQRYVVWHYRYDPDRRERRDVVVMAFDEESEFRACFEMESEALARRKQAGCAEPVERIGGAFMPVGHRTAMAEMRARQQADLAASVKKWRNVQPISPMPASDCEG